MNVRTLLAEGRKRLTGQAAGQLESELLLCHVLGVDRAWLYANPERLPEAGQTGKFIELIGRRESGEPIAYLTGLREFWSLPLKVTRDVLIPRPETELLVQSALEFIPEDAAWRVADLGTGSGAIALALAVERPRCEIHATDRSEASLRVARENARNLAPGRIHFHAGDWLEPLQGRFQVVISNPPYVAAGDPHLHSGDCRYEPVEALTPGPDALACIRHIIRASPPFFCDGGLLALEHGFDQAIEVRRLFQEHGYTRIGTREDLEGKPRVTCGFRA